MAPAPAAPEPMPANHARASPCSVGRPWLTMQAVLMKPAARGVCHNTPPCASTAIRARPEASSAARVLLMRRALAR